MVARSKELTDADVSARVQAVGLVMLCALWDVSFAKTCRYVREHGCHYDTNDLHTDWQGFRQFFWRM